MMLFCFLQASWAQTGWDFGESSVEEIVGGPDKYYIIQQSYNPNGQSSNGYLNSGAGGVLAAPDSTCVYSFIEVGTKEYGGQSYPVYVLKSYANGKYLNKTSEKYGTLDKAFKFTARKGVLYEGAGTDVDDWAIYSNYVYYQQCVDAGAWVLCSSTERDYISINENPAFYPYVSTNNWIIYEATQRELSAYEKFEQIYEQYFAVEVNSENYPVGTGVGCITQEMYDELSSVYAEATAARNNPATSDAEYDRIRGNILTVFEKYAQNVVPLVAGYYVLVNNNLFSAAYDEGGSYARCSMGKSAPDEWNLETSNHIWELVDAGEPGKFYIRNFKTGRYLGKSRGADLAFPFVDTESVPFTIENSHGVWFAIYEGKSSVGCQDDGYVRTLSDASKLMWRFDMLDPDVLAGLKEQVDQIHRNESLAQLVELAKNDVASVQTISGITFDGNYKSNAPGLVNTLEGANSVEPLPSYSDERNLFDGDLQTLYHTAWKTESAIPDDDWNWIQVDLGRELQEFYVKFSHRHDGSGNSPTVISFVASEDDDLEAPQWLDTLYKDTVIYQYSTPYPAGAKDSTTYVGKIALKRPAQHIRMVVHNTFYNTPTNFGPRWCVSELRFYDAAECTENPRLALMPKEVRDNLDSWIAKAEEEVKANAATQATYDALEAALDAFWEAYPDPAGLESALDAAQAKVDAADESKAEPGYFREGAKAAMQEVIDGLREELASKIFSLDELEAARKRLDAGLQEFYAKMYVPEAGKVYRIANVAGFNEDGSEVSQNGGLLATLNADINDAAAWGYDIQEDAEERFNTLWYMEAGEDGYAFRNLANGFYLKNTFDGMTEEEVETEIEEVTDEPGRRIRYSKEPSYFKFRPGVKAGDLMLALVEDQFLALNNTGYAVRYFTADNPAGQFRLVEVTDDNGFSTSYKKDAKVGEAQVMSIPFDVAYVFSNNYTAMKVLGVKEGYVQLQAYADDEIIPAGTPFIIKTDAENAETETSAENFVMIDLVNQSVEESLNLTYNYKPVVQNGLVSAPCAFTLEAGYGYLFSDKVLVSEGGETVAAGTGFFNSELPATEDEGEYVLELTGQLTGEGVAVDGVEVVKNQPVDVYTLTGVKIRSAVRMTEAVKGLPKGIYIVGGKKVLVK